MSTAFERGYILYSQSRYDLADREFRRELAEDPDNPLAHAFLALCLTERDRGAEALSEADEAVRLGADEGFNHYVRGRVLCDLDRYKDAEAATREAIRLDPDEAGFFGQLSNIAFQRRNWAEALEAANQGLALDPENTGCTNLRAMALVQLGRKDEAAQTLGSALADDPENALTHANQGWALLHQGNHALALEHFREALRLDPELEWARVGIVESLKARHLLYRIMLRFFLWMGRQGQAAQWVVVFGFIFGRRVLNGIARDNPKLAPILIPISALLFAFLILTWLSSPLFNLLLRFNKFGRLALSREQRVESTWIGAFFGIALGCFLAHLVFPSGATLVGMAYFGFLLMPLAVTFQQDEGRPRLTMAACTGLIALLGLPLLSIAVLGNLSPWRNPSLAFSLFMPYFIIGSVFSTWIPLLTGLRSSR